MARLDELLPSSSPPPATLTRSRMTLQGRTVLFGGLTAASSTLNDTWGGMARRGSGSRVPGATVARVPQHDTIPCRRRSCCSAACLRSLVHLGDAWAGMACAGFSGRHAPRGPLWARAGQCHARPGPRPCQRHEPEHHGPVLDPAALRARRPLRAARRDRTIVRVPGPVQDRRHAGHDVAGSRWFGR